MKTEAIHDGRALRVTFDSGFQITVDAGLWRSGAKLALRQVLGLPLDAPDATVDAEVRRILSYALTKREWFSDVLRQEWPDLLWCLEALCGEAPTLFPEGNLATITRSGIRCYGLTMGCRHDHRTVCPPSCAEPAWLPISQLHIFRLSDSFIRRLARTGRVDSFQHPAGNYLIRVQSLRDYCDKRDKRRA